MKVLAICIPTYNRRCYLENMLKTLEKEGCFQDDRIEVIVSDNCSTDTTGKYLDSIEKIFQNLQIIHQNKNIGGVGNLLSIQKFVSAKYIWYVGDDDRIEKGAVSKILNVLKEYRDIHHVFLNYTVMEKEKKLDEKCYHGTAGIWNEGFEMFQAVAEEAGLGSLMFITGNIFLFRNVIQANEIIKDEIKNLNYALPLGYSLFCSDGKGYAFHEPLVKDDVSNVTWSAAQVRVWCRDMISICDRIGESMGKGKEVRTLLLKYLPVKYPEIEYAFKGRKFGLDNYALNMYLKYHKFVLCKDVCIYPFYKIIKRIIWRWEKRKAGI